MSDYIEIIGGKPLTGSVRASGAKNAALPILIACLLTPEKCSISNIPNLQDVSLTLRLLEHFGAHVEYSDGKAEISVPKLVAKEASFSLVKSLRASFWVLAPVLARGGAARVAMPGGDIIGARPVDMHLEALRQMGADIRVKHGVVYATAEKGLKPAEIKFRFPSVGATHQVLMAASLTPGRTVLRGAAKEPEVVALAEFINSMGCRIIGAGEADIEIEGQEILEGGHCELIGDRIEAASYLLACAATGGKGTIEGIRAEFFESFLEVLERMGVGVERGADSVSIRPPSKLKSPGKVKTGPFPQFATDIQAPLLAALSIAEGESELEETVFDGRFGHVSELCRMGANITVEHQIARVKGVEALTGAPVECMDIRAGAALVIAALAASGTSCISEVQHLRRGYCDLERKVSALGGQIFSRVSDPEDFLFTGC